MSALATTPEMRLKLATTAAAIASESDILGRIDAEVAGVLDEQPMLPRTESVRRILWALVFLNLFQMAAETPAAETAKKKATA